MKSPLQNGFNVEMLDFAPVIIAFFDENQKMIWANKAYQKATGFSLEKMKGKPWHVVWGLDQPCTGCPVTKALENAAPREAELTSKTVENWRDAQGSWFSKAAPITDINNRIIGAVEVAFEISARMQSEEHLRKSEKNLSRAQQMAQLGYWRWDVQTGDVEWSDEVYKIFRLDPKTFTPHIDSIMALSPWPEDHERDLELIRKATESREKGAYEQRFLRPDGTTGYYFSTFQGIYNPSGDLIEIVGTVQDITEQVAQEKEYRELINGMNDTVFVIGLDGKFKEVNDTAIKMLGYTRKELLSLGPQDIDPYLTAAEIKHLMETIKPNQPQVIQTQHKTKQGALIPVEISSSMISMHGKPAILSIARNISARNQAEAERENLQRQLVQAQKMESVGRLAGGVAHDFNNMLYVILGHTELVMQQIDPDSPLNAKLQEIKKAAERSANLTRQLLAFARRQVIAPKVLDLNETLAGMLKMLRRLIGEDIELTWLPGADLWPVKIDPSQVDQVLANLCVNARDAITGIGKLIIETKNIHLDEAYCAQHVGFVPGAYVMLAVSDDGCGMDKETLSHLFEPFFTSKDVDQGTGLGLAMVYGIVKQNGGFINVYSEPGKGTTLKIYLPRFAGHEVEKSTGLAPPLARGGGETILLVEDEKIVLALGRKMLEDLGYTVLYADKPSRALQIAEKFKGTIDVLLTDVVMPEMSGRDLATRVVALRPGLKCIYMSGYTANVIAHHGVLEEGIVFIQKPFSQQDLATRLSEVLHKK